MFDERTVLTLNVALRLRPVRHARPFLDPYRLAGLLECIGDKLSPIVRGKELRGT